MLPALVLLLAAVAYRLLLAIAGAQLPGWLPNFSPVSAIALCGAIFLPRGFAISLPLIILLISDVIINVHRGVALLTLEMWPRYIALSFIVAIGIFLRDKVRFTGVLVAAFGCSVLFYVVSNTGSWIGEPQYAKTATGWFQALTVGLPGHPPSWVFFRNGAVSDLLFTALFLVCAHVGLSAREPLKVQAVRS
jgi:hypothetical protein